MFWCRFEYFGDELVVSTYNVVLRQSSISKITSDA